MSDLWGIGNIWGLIFTHKSESWGWMSNYGDQWGFIGIYNIMGLSINIHKSPFPINLISPDTSNQPSVTCTSSAVMEDIVNVSPLSYLPQNLLSHPLGGIVIAYICFATKKQGIQLKSRALLFILFILVDCFPGLLSLLWRVMKSWLFWPKKRPRSTK